MARSITFILWLVIISARHPERSEESPEFGIAPFDWRSLAALGMTCE
ncbi:MAG: hypothetical protein NTW08_09535 [Gammaproteobacteria bacterium]|nr:hypothetical protein [Gammaproteobacteria bacterium]